MLDCGGRMRLYSVELLNTFDGKKFKKHVMLMIYKKY